MQLIQMFGRKPDLLLDQKCSDWDADLFGVQCSGLEKLSAIPKTSNFVITVSDYNDMAKLLMQMDSATFFYLIRKNRVENKSFEQCVRFRVEVATH